MTKPRINLREAFLAAAVAHVDAHGHADLSGRSLSRALGVSVGAPYHHFPDRLSLLSEVALEGYRDLFEGTDRMQAEASSAQVALESLGLALLAFAQRRPRMFDLMYSSELFEPGPDPRIRAAQLSGHRLLSEAIARAVPDLPRPEIETRTFAYWAMLWGHANLLNRRALRSFETMDLPGDLPARIVRLAVEAILAR